MTVPRSLKQHRTHTHARTHARMHTHARTHTHTHTHTRARADTHAHTHTRARRHTRTVCDARKHACTHAHMHTRTFTHLYTHARKASPRGSPPHGEGSCARKAQKGDECEVEERAEAAGGGGGASGTEIGRCTGRQRSRRDRHCVYGGYCHRSLLRGTSKPDAVPASEGSEKLSSIDDSNTAVEPDDDRMTERATARNARQHTACSHEQCATHHSCVILYMNEKDHSMNARHSESRGTAQQLRRGRSSSASHCALHDVCMAHTYTLHAHDAPMECDSYCVSNPLRNKQ